MGSKVDIHTTWQAVLGEIELSVSRGNYITWFKNTVLIDMDDDQATIGVPNIFIQQQLERKYYDLVAATLQHSGFQPARLVFKIHSQQPTTHQASDSGVVLPAPGAAKTTANSEAGAPSFVGGFRQGISRAYTFDNFVVGAGNELAFAACQSIAAHPGVKYNPLFLYGGVGIGKTHLIQAVGNALQARQPDIKIVYITTEQFVQEFVHALRHKKAGDFANHYRSADTLIVDDIQFIAGKEKIQEEFFHTFNTLHQANKQIIISSDKPPRDIPTLEERLKSRFAWGMTIDMQNPDFETRCAIIQTKASNQSVELADDVVEFLANNVPTNVRELEGALNRLLAFCEMRNMRPTLEIATSLLGAAASRPKRVSAKQVIDKTARHFNISHDDILSSKRDKDIVLPRQVAMYLLRDELHLSFPKIARELGRKDHTTAIHSVEKIGRSSQLDPAIRAALSEIKGELYA